MLTILIVDDKPERYSFFNEEVVGKFATAEGIQVVSSVRDALSRLEKQVFDVLVLDMMVPPTPWSADNGNLGGLDLLEHLAEDDSLKKPRYLIGVTAATEPDSEVSTYFDNSPWSLIRNATNGSAWQDRLLKLLKHASELEQAVETRHYRTDICFVTALPTPEQAALFRLPINWATDSEFLDSNTSARTGQMTDRQGRTLSVVAGCSLRMGGVEAALLCSKLIARYRPKILVMAGICAGVEGKTQYGDAILAATTWDWTSSKWALDDHGTEQVLPAPHYVECEREVVSRFRMLQQDTVALVKIWSDWDGEKPAAPVSLHIGPMASGPIVLANGTTLDEIRKTQNREVLGLEMETYGVYCAAQYAGRPRPIFLSVKSVCDFADPRKNDAMQKYSAFTSARVVHEFLMKYGFEISGLAAN